MTYNLNSRLYTLLADTVDTFDVVADTPVNTITGNDVIKGTSVVAPEGIKLASTAVLDMSYGDDLIAGISDKNPGTGLSNAGLLLMGFGNDTVKGEVTSLVGSDAPYHRGIDNRGSGLLDTGFGDDSVIGISGVNGYGINNTINASISTGFGRDLVQGRGGNGFGIYNDGLINTGFDDDVIQGISNLKYAGFGGTGLTQLGYGNDRSEGFGTGFFDAGAGSDQLRLPAGTYTVSPLNPNGYYNVSLAGAAEVMQVKGYESIGLIGAAGTSVFAPGLYNL